MADELDEVEDFDDDFDEGLGLEEEFDDDNAGLDALYGDGEDDDEEF